MTTNNPSTGSAGTNGNAGSGRRFDAKQEFADLERRIDQVREELDRRIEALDRRRLREPLLRRPVTYWREHRSEIPAAIGSAVKEHPLPAILTAVGIALLAASSIHATRQTPVRRLRARLRRPLSQMQDRWQDATDYARRSFHDTRDYAADRAADAWQFARDRAFRARHHANDTFEERPLILGALAVALGAALGAAIPSTTSESRLWQRLRERSGKADTEGSQTSTTGQSGSSGYAPDDPLQHISGHS
jgi:hypothetical protein